MRLIVCKHCDDTFDRNSRRKREVGGYIDECPSCVLDLQTETAETIRGVVSGDGKMACIQILKFGSKSEADLYCKAWNANSGWNNRRSGGLDDVRFQKIGENAGNTNHKGKL